MIENKKYEEYIRSSDKESFLKGLVPESYEYYYFKVLYLTGVKNPNDHTQQEKSLLDEIIASRSRYYKWETYKEFRNIPHFEFREVLRRLASD